MDQLTLNTVNTQLTNDNELLKSQVLHLTERFSIIVNWINNQFYELLGVPEQVAVAIRGNPDTVPVIPRSNDEESLPRRRKTNSVTQQSIRNKSLSYNPFVALEKLNVEYIQSLAASNEISNYDAIVESLSELNLTSNASLTCTICNRSFKLNIQLKKHKMIHLMKKLNKPQRQERKVSNSEMINSNPLRTFENMFMKLEMHSESSDSDTNSLHDPLDDSEKNVIIRNSPYSVNLDFNNSTIKDETEIKIESSEDIENISTGEMTNPLPKANNKQSGNLQSNPHEKNNIKPPRPYTKRVKVAKDGIKCKFCGKEFPMFCRLRVHARRCQVPRNRYRKKPQYYSDGKNNGLNFSTSETTYHFPKANSEETGNQKCNPHGENNLTSPRPYTRKGRRAEEDLKCKDCGKEFPMFCRLKVHKKKCHVPSDAVIVTESEIEGVKKIETTYKCLKCEAHFTLKKQYFSHQKKCIPGQKIMDLKQPAICELCGKRFASHHCLSTHMRCVHQGEKNFLCTECGKSFSRLDTLANHEKCHTGTRNFKCSYCEKTFTTRQSKYFHEKRHLGALKTNCPICGGEFASRSNVMSHIQCVHKNRRSHQCPLCEKSFKQKSALNYHLKTHNNPNGRKRGLNKDIDHMQAAQKRKHCNKKNDTLGMENSNTSNPNKSVNDNVMISSLGGENISTR